MLSPWVMDEIRSHPYRMWLIQAVGLLTFTLVMVYQMPSNKYTVNVYPTKSPRVQSSTDNNSVESKGMAVNKPVSVRPSRAPRGSVPDPLPGTPVPSASPSPSPSEPSEPSPGPSVPPGPPSEPPGPPVDQGTPPVVTPPVTPPDNSNDEKPQTGTGTKGDSTKDPLPQRVNIYEANEFGPRIR